MTAKPATIAGDILERLNRAVASGQSPDQMTVARLRRDIDSLRAVDPALGWVALSAVESALFDDDAAVHAARQAVSLAPARSEVALNGSLSLTRVGRYVEAFEILHNTASRVRGDALLWERYADVAYFVGRFSIYRSAFTHWQGLLQNEGRYPHVVDSIEDFLRRSNYAEEDFSAVVLAAQKVLTESKIRDSGIVFMHLAAVGGYAERVSIAIDVDVDVPTLLELEQGVFDRLEQLALPIEVNDLVSVRLKRYVAGATDGNQVKAIA
jgi:hypothetical protein